MTQLYPHGPCPGGLGTVIRATAMIPLGIHDDERRRSLTTATAQRVAHSARVLVGGYTHIPGPADP
jgi:hypothetical protein